MMPQDQTGLPFTASPILLGGAVGAWLAAGDASVPEQGKLFELRLPAISRHLNMLGNAGIIVRGRDPRRPPRRPAVRALKDAAEWLKEFRRFWEGSSDRLDDHLRKVQKEEKQDGRRQQTRHGAR
jgi:DNA-binding transcriptional ArsR family regulator